MLAQYLIQHRIHPGAYPNGPHNLNAVSFDQVTRYDNLADKTDAQFSVLGLDDHHPLALDQFPLHKGLPEDDDPVHQPLAVGLTLLQAQELLHQEPLRVARLRIPPGHFGLMFAHGYRLGEGGLLVYPTVGPLQPPAHQADIIRGIC